MTAPFGWMKSTCQSISEDRYIADFEHSHFSRIIALADLLNLVCWRVLLCDEVCHAHDFVLFVILDHIGLLDDRHKVLGMTDLALQSTPDLQEYLVSLQNFAMADTKR